MATAKQKQESSYALGILVGFIVCLPLLVISIIQYFRLKTRYSENEYTQRIFDVGNLARPLVLASLLIVITWKLYAFTASSTSTASTVVAGIIIACFLYTLFQISKSISSTYFGILIDPKNDRIVIPKDLGNYSIPDYLQLKFITELGAMEEVSLSQIKRMTRQGGKKLFIHGKFGSRGIRFSRKQKRDECLSAVGECSSARTTLEFEGN